MIFKRLQLSVLQRRFRLQARFVLFGMLFLLGAMTANGQETSLLDIKQGSELTAVAGHLGRGGYELSDGTRVSFEKWYRSKWIDMRFEMLTKLSDDFGVLWGASSGQRAKKVRIDPAMELGFIVQKRPTPSTTLSLIISSILGGTLTEQPCTANYGDIGGVQTVNCRLAASRLPPADTLKQLIHVHPNRFRLSLRFKGQF
ncbi:hypothetical protein GCM10007880_67260 [Mesorhizobium amorphae]|uniref:hypothetical protein n=1 Tax=Mesorhizobium amorphae TaxID=71433 RepID=UPI00235BF4A0|nr:hypothetical protein [Mesorhizobium amorphae]GLR46208.1 hypothetical protein GCM10007880_67260 [Mesorhizobium amorphae]